MMPTMIVSTACRVRGFSCSVKQYTDKISKQRFLPASKGTIDVKGVYCRASSTVGKRGRQGKTLVRT